MYLNCIRGDDLTELIEARVVSSAQYDILILIDIHLYLTWVERGTVRVKCLAQEHDTMSPARAQ